MELLATALMRLAGQKPSEVMAGQTYKSVTLEAVKAALGLYPASSIFWGRFAEELQKKYDLAEGDIPDKVLDEYIAIRMKDMQELYKTWKFPKEIYRCLNIKGAEDIDLKKIGFAWGATEDGALCSDGSEEDGPEHLIRATVPNSHVAWDETYAENIIMYEYSDTKNHTEREIRIKPGSKITITGIKRAGDDKWQDLNLKGVA